MRKQELQTGVQELKGETKAALEAILAQLNRGQRQKLWKEEAVRALLSRYGLEEEV